MLSLGFGVHHIPGTLPDVVFALFSGLNAAAVGLIALAAYDLSKKVITDPLTRIEVLLSAAFANCYESQWLYPVLMVAGGLATLILDTSIAWGKKRRLRKGTQRSEEASCTPQIGLQGMGIMMSHNIHSTGDIEMQNVPAPIATALPSRQIDKESIDAPISSAQPNPSALTHRGSTVGQDAPAQQSYIKANDSELEQPEYFSLGVRTGLFMSVTVESIAHVGVMNH